jgi:kinesin family protein 11
MLCIHLILFLGVFFPATSAEERESVCSVVNVVKIHANTLEKFREDHAGQATSIEHRACETFQQEYMVGYFVV